jgi:ATP-dependent protease HslVU (ClpYQ) peptidase subunit
MTCIVGVVSDGKVYIGGDSAGVNAEGHLQLRKDPKVFKNGEYLIGVSGSWRAMQALKSAKFEDLTRIANLDPFFYMVEWFLPAIRKLNLPEENLEMLVGFRGRLFHIYGTSQVSEEIADFEACGSGAQVARGALHITPSYGAGSMLRIHKALEAAERFCSGVRGPFTILCTENE